MGVSASTIKRTDSAAFGRLRIDSPQILSPGPGSVRTSLERRRQLRLAEHLQYTTTNAGPSSSVGDNLQSLIKPIPPQHTFIPQSSSETSRLIQKIPHGGAQSPDVFGTKIVGSPPLQVWIIPALGCAMAYALYNIFIKKGSSHVNPVLGGVILQLVAALLGTGLLLFLICTQGGAEVIVYDGEGIKYAILAGIAVGLAEITSFFVSSLGVQAMQSIPIIIGGSVMFGTVIGSLVLHEELSLRGWFGVVMISLGISLVGLDSSGEAAG